MSKEENDKKFKQKFKNIFEPRILNATWENEGMQVSLKKIKLYNLNKDNFQKRQIIIKKRRKKIIKISHSKRSTGIFSSKFMDFMLQS